MCKRTYFIWPVKVVHVSSRLLASWREYFRLVCGWEVVHLRFMRRPQLGHFAGCKLSQEFRECSRCLDMFKLFSAEGFFLEGAAKRGFLEGAAKLCFSLI